MYLFSFFILVFYSKGQRSALCGSIVAVFKKNKVLDFKMQKVSSEIKKKSKQTNFIQSSRSTHHSMRFLTEFLKRSISFLFNFSKGCRSFI